MTSLATSKKYNFKVAAENEAGLSEWETIGPITVQDLTILPEADLSSIPGNVINMREGGKTKMIIPYSGKPVPFVKWSKERIPIKSNFMQNLIKLQFRIQSC